MHIGKKPMCILFLCGEYVIKYKTGLLVWERGFMEKYIEGNKAAWEEAFDNRDASLQGKKL